MNFSFALDGKTDMMSLNPLEMTNFEMMGTIFGVGGVILTLIVGRLRARRAAAADVFVAQQTEEDAVEQIP